MSLSCDCDDGEGWYYFAPDDYTRLSTKRARHCCSCGARIAVGDLCVEFKREDRPDEGSVSYRIYGEEMPLAPWHMCEACGDQYFNLVELGYCITLVHGENMRDLVRERGQIYD